MKGETVDLWVAIGLIMGVIGVIVSAYYGRRSLRPAVHGPHIQVRVSNFIPVYDLPDGSQSPGDHFIGVEAVNSGDRSIAITGWGVKLPGDRRVVVRRAENWATPLPHELRPGAAPARLVMLADELRRLEREEQISYEAMRPYVTLADGTEVLADKSVPLA